MNKVTALAKNYITDESGATAIEYGLIAALVAIGMVTGATALGTSLDTRFSDFADKVDAA